MKSPPIAGLLLISCALLHAQSPLRISGFDSPTATWVQDIEDGTATIRYDELPGEHTLLFVQTTIDPTVAGFLVAQGIISALPFLATPIKSQWTLSSPELQALTDYTFSGEDPMVPPRRLANHISMFVQSNYGSGYGTYNPSTSTFITRETAPGMVATPTVKADERQPWDKSTWTYMATHGFHNFDTAQLGREAVIQAAYEYQALLPNSPPINKDALDALNSLLDADLGFEIYVQAAHIKAPTTSGEQIKVRLSRHARIRRRSLQQNSLGWTTVMGADRYAPHPTAANTNIWLAPLADELHIIFPTEVSSLAHPTTLRAYVPTIDGITMVEQIPNPVLYGVLLRPEVGIFPCPPNTIAGTVYFERLQVPGEPFAPVGAHDRGAFIWPFVPVPPEPPVPPSPPPVPQ